MHKIHLEVGESYLDRRGRTVKVVGLDNKKRTYIYKTDQNTHHSQDGFIKRGRMLKRDLVSLVIDDDSPMLFGAMPETIEDAFLLSERAGAIIQTSVNKREKHVRVGRFAVGMAAIAVIALLYQLSKEK